MFALIQSENHATNKGKTAGRYKFDTHPTGIGSKKTKAALELQTINPVDLNFTKSVNKV